MVVVADCIIDGKSYPNNGIIPSEDPCQICQCIDSEMVCANEVCDEPEEHCKLMPPTKDECCNYKCADETSSVSNLQFY